MRLFAHFLPNLANSLCKCLTWQKNAPFYSSPHHSWLKEDIICSSRSGTNEEGRMSNKPGFFFLSFARQSGATFKVSSEATAVKIPVLLQDIFLPRQRELCSTQKSHAYRKPRVFEGSNFSFKKTGSQFQ